MQLVLKWTYLKKNHNYKIVLILKKFSQMHIWCPSELERNFKKYSHNATSTTLIYKLKEIPKHNVKAYTVILSLFCTFIIIVTPIFVYSTIVSGIGPESCVRPIMGRWPMINHETTIFSLVKIWETSKVSDKKFVI